MTIYSKQLGYVSLTAVGNATLMTAPAGFATVVRCVSLDLGVNWIGTLEAVIAGVGPFIRLLRLDNTGGAAPIQETLNLNGLVLNPGDELVLATTGAGVTGRGQAIASGYELTA